MNNKVSIIMGIYNCEDTLSEAIESILAQTYTNWELILCDDNSKDSTYIIAKNYQEKYPEKIVLIKNTENKKLGYTLNHCLKYASGHFIARMDGDDISAPNRIEKQIEFLKNNPQYDLVGTAMQRFNGAELADIIYPTEFPTKYILKRTVPFCHATILTYKYVYDKLGGYTVLERTERCEDLDLWFKFYYYNFKGASLLEPLYLVREDRAAIRRRTFKTRKNALKTIRNGYRLLSFPKRWLIRPIIETYLKSLVPYRIIELYRWKQKRNQEKKR